MRTLTVLLVVSLFFLVSFEAFASDRPVTKTGITPVEWTTALPVVVIDAQSMPIFSKIDTQGTEVARRCRNRRDCRRMR